MYIKIKGGLHEESEVESWVRKGRISYLRINERFENRVQRYTYTCSK